jgi:hypothetical protein
MVDGAGGASSGENPGLRVRVTDHFTPVNGHPCAGSVGPLNPGIYPGSLTFYGIGILTL